MVTRVTDWEGGRRHVTDRGRQPAKVLRSNHSHGGLAPLKDLSMICCGTPTLMVVMEKIVNDYGIRAVLGTCPNTDVNT